MEQRYSFHVDPQRPTEEQMARHRDFQAVLHRHRAAEQARRGRRLRRLRNGLAIAAGLALLVLMPLLLSNPQGAVWSPELAEAHFEQEPLVTPPLPQLEPAYVEREIRAEESQAIKLSPKSTLTIPADAFADAAGRPVRGEVVLRYREMKDPVDFFLAGIPMHYDSAGRRYQLESAGMVEILAEQDGRPLRMQPRKSMQVQLVSQVYWQAGEARPKFNIYHLDTARRNWVYEEPASQNWEGWMDGTADGASQLALAQLEEYLRRIQEEAEQRRRSLQEQYPLPEPPAAPYALRPDLPSFDLDLADDALVLEQADGQAFDPEERRRLQEEYAHTTWQVSPQSAEVDTRAFNVQWQGFRLQQLGPYTYRLTLIHEAREEELIVHPILSGEKLAQAQAEFETARESYRSEMALREDQMAPRLQQLEARVKKEREEAWSNYRSILAQLEEREVQTDQVTTTFALTRLGIWNVDAPHLPAQAPVKARFVSAEGSPIGGRTAWLADRARNTVFRYYAAKGTPVHLNPQKDQVLWVVTEQGRLAVLRREDLAALSGEEEPTLVLHEVDRDLKSAEEVREVLRI